METAINKILKNAGRVLRKHLPEDREAIEDLMEALESQEAGEEITHLQDTIKSIEDSLMIIYERGFADLSEEDMGEVAEIAMDLHKFKMELDIMVDTHLGQGALAASHLPDEVLENPPEDFDAWGARRMGDPEFAMTPPVIPLAEASIEGNMLKELIKIANELDSRGLVKEADGLDRMTKEAIAPLLMEESKLEKLYTFSNAKNLAREANSIRLLTKSADTSTLDRDGDGEISPEEKTIGEQNVKVDISNLDETINAFASLLNSIAQKEGTTMEAVLQAVQRSANGPIAQAITKAVSASSEEINKLLRKEGIGQLRRLVQQQQQQPQAAAAAPGAQQGQQAASKTDKVTVSILRYAGQFKKLGEEVMMAVQQLMVSKYPHQTGGMSPEYMASAKYEITQAINRNQLIASPGSKQIIKSLIFRFL
jgi:hypothetical protein